MSPDHTDLRQPDLSHQILERAQRVVELLIGLGTARENEVAVQVAHRQRIAASAVRQIKPALEVDRPHVIGLRRLGQPIAWSLVGTRFSPPFHAQSVAPEDLSNCASRRRSLDLMLQLKHPIQLLRPPGSMQPPFRHNQGLDLLCGSLGHAMRSMTPHSEAIHPLIRVSFQMLVPGFPADPELLTQLGHGESPAFRKAHKSNYLVHSGYIFPRHVAVMCNPSLWTICHLSLRIIPTLVNSVAAHGAGLSGPE